MYNLGEKLDKVFIKIGGWHKGCGEVVTDIPWRIPKCPEENNQCEVCKKKDHEKCLEILSMVSLDKKREQRKNRFEKWLQVLEGLSCRRWDRLFHCDSKSKTTNHGLNLQGSWFQLDSWKYFLTIKTVQEWTDDFFQQRLGDLMLRILQYGFLDR